MHLLVKYTDVGADTIKEHRAVLGRQGAVLIGKFGRPLSAETLGRMAAQAAAGVPTFLFLSTRLKSGFVAHRCTVSEVLDHLPAKDRSLVPAYYPSHALGTWFRVTAISGCSPAEMERLYVPSTGRRLSDVISAMASVYRVAIR